MFVVENGYAAPVLLKDVCDLRKELVAWVLLLSDLIAWIVTVLADDQHGIHGKCVAAAAQSLRNAGIDRKPKFSRS